MKIDDIFKMKTSLDFDDDEYKFQSKMSILELVFADTRQSIGHVEFDLGSYTNKIRDSMVKTVLDLKSDKYPGSQIYIYVNIQLLDPLPEQNGHRGTVVNSTMNPQDITDKVRYSIANTVELNKLEISKESL